MGEGSLPTQPTLTPTAFAHRTATPVIVVGVIALLLVLDLWLAGVAQPTPPLPMYDCPVGSGANAPSYCAP
jgi:hypothetical protein